MQVALAWLLQRSPNILLIPGTSSLQHLRENLQSSMLQIAPEVIADLDAIGTRPTGSTSRRSTAVHRGTVASGRKDAPSQMTTRTNVSSLDSCGADNPCPFPRYAGEMVSNMVGIYGSMS
jgi:hypothetical protein